MHLPPRFFVGNVGAALPATAAGSGEFGLEGTERELVDQVQYIYRARAQEQKRHGAPGGTGHLVACPLAGGASNWLGWVAARRRGGKAWVGPPPPRTGRTERAPSAGPPGCVCVCVSQRA
jgi:hypothetical protein